MISVFCLSYNRKMHLADFVDAFFKNDYGETQLVLGLQGCTDGSLQVLRERPWFFDAPHCKLVLWNENIGLNRYDELITHCDGDILCDTDDDSLLPSGFERVFEDVLQDKRFAWVGIAPQDARLIKIASGREWLVNGYRILEAAVGGGLAATRRETYNELHGFGVGTTNFDPEDARYQRKCIAAGYQTGVIVSKDGQPLSYEHRGGWDWKIKYGCAQQKLDSLFEAHRCGFLTKEQYQNSIKEYTEALMASDG